MNKQRVTGIIIALIVALGLITSVSAHAKLEQSTPAAGAKLASAPAKITLKFSEEISAAPTDSYFSVANAQGANVGSGLLDNTDLDHKTLSGTLNSGASNGVYTVTWFTVTTDDNGHSTGTFTFGVNVDPDAQPTAKPQAEDDDATTAPTSAATSTSTTAPTPASSTSATQPTPTIAAPGLPNTSAETNNNLAMLFVALALLVIGGIVVRRFRVR